jgi:ParB family chromosome partitioning protein
VTKARILGAVREAKGEQAAQLIDHLKKGEMAEKAEVLLAGSGWLPEPLRTPGRFIASLSSALDEDAISVADSGGVETTAVGCETAMVETEASIQDGQAVIDPQAAAAE